MKQFIIKPFNVIDRTQLQEIAVDHIPTDGDPIEIDGEMYYVCENSLSRQTHPDSIGLIPLVVRNPSKVKNIKNYIECLSLAHRKVLFKNENGSCDLDSCNEMVIT